MQPDRVYHVQHTVKIGDDYESSVSDLIFVDGRPVAVLAWDGAPGDERPLVQVPLDSAYLEECRSGHITHLYLSAVDLLAAAAE